MATVEASSKPRLVQRYHDEVVKALREKFGLKNVNQVPRLKKVVINMGVGKAIDNKKRIEEAVLHLSQITGQKPVVCVSKLAVAGFRLREGLPIGVKVDLRGARMWEFLDRLITFGLPRVRDFKGVSPKGFDGKGNYTLGVKEQIIFPEINYDQIEKVKGLNVSIVTTAKNDEHGLALLKAFGVPFRAAA